jgi:MFS family permease
MRLSFVVVLIAVVAVAFARVEPGGRLSARPRTREAFTSGERFATIPPSPVHLEHVVAPHTTKAVGKWNGPACILGGALAHLTLGTLYCWGNFLSYAPANLRFFDGLEHPGQQPDALYVIPFTIIAQAIALPVGPYLTKAIGSSRTLLLGSWITAAAVYLASYQTTLSSFMLFYALMFGLGAGLAYTAPMGAGWKWMPASKGLVSGGILAGFGSGGFLFSMIGSRHVNPTGANLVGGKFPPSVYARFPTMLRKLALMYAAISFVGSLLITEPTTLQAAVQVLTPNMIPSAGDLERKLNTHIQCFSRLLSPADINVLTAFREGPLSRLPPEAQLVLRRVLNTIPELVDKLPPPAQKFLTEVVKLPCLTSRQCRAQAAAHNSAAHGAPTATGLYSPRGLTVGQALGTKQFWLMWTLIITCATAGLNTAAVYKQFAATSQALTGDEFQALVGGIGALFNGFGRIFWGTVSDRLGFKLSFTVLSVLQAVSMLTYTASTQSKVKTNYFTPLALSVGT